MMRLGQLIAALLCIALIGASSIISVGPGSDATAQAQGEPLLNGYWRYTAEVQVENFASCDDWLLGVDYLSGTYIATIRIDEFSAYFMEEYPGALGMTLVVENGQLVDELGAYAFDLDGFGPEDAGRVIADRYMVSGLPNMLSQEAGIRAGTMSGETVSVTFGYADSLTLEVTVVSASLVTGTLVMDSDRCPTTNHFTLEFLSEDEPEGINISEIAYTPPGGAQELPIVADGGGDTDTFVEPPVDSVAVPENAVTLCFWENTSCLLASIPEGGVTLVPGDTVTGSVSVDTPAVYILQAQPGEVVGIRIQVNNASYSLTDSSGAFYVEDEYLSESDETATVLYTLTGQPPYILTIDAIEGSGAFTLTLRSGDDIIRNQGVLTAGSTIQDTVETGSLVVYTVEGEPGDWVRIEMEISSDSMFGFLKDADGFTLQPFAYMGDDVTIHDNLYILTGTPPYTLPIQGDGTYTLTLHEGESAVTIEDLMPGETVTGLTTSEQFFFYNLTNVNTPAVALVLRPLEENSTLFVVDTVADSQGHIIRETARFSVPVGAAGSDEVFFTVVSGLATDGLVFSVLAYEGYSLTAYEAMPVRVMEDTEVSDISFSVEIAETYSLLAGDQLTAVARDDANGRTMVVLQAQLTGAWIDNALIEPVLPTQSLADLPAFEVEPPR